MSCIPNFEAEKKLNISLNHLKFCRFSSEKASIIFHIALFQIFALSPGS